MAVVGDGEELEDGGGLELGEEAEEDGEFELDDGAWEIDDCVPVLDNEDMADVWSVDGAWMVDDGEGAVEDEAVGLGIGQALALSRFSL